MENFPIFDFIMKKFLKTTLILIVSVFLIVFANGCYYVFYGQEKSVEKLEQGKDLNAYEIASIYSMHTACWMFGWVISPEAAKLVFCKQFHIDNYDFFGQEHKERIVWSESPVVQKAIDKVLLEGPGSRAQVYWKDYSKDTRVALALNGSYIVGTETTVYGEICNTFYFEARTDYKPGIIYIKGIKFYETLFDYLENIGILSNPTFYI